MPLSFKPTSLKLVRPVPTEIDIAQSADIKPIAQIADEAGILEDEVKFYGTNAEVLGSSNIVDLPAIAMLMKCTLHAAELQV